MNMRIETGISSKCMNCNGDNDIKTIEVTLANGFIVKPMTLCKDCRRELMELLTTEFETENEVTEKSIAENDPDPIHVGARVYVADFEHKNRCPYGTITRCLSEEESKAACYLGRLVEIAFDDGLTNELTHGYRIVEDEKAENKKALQHHRVYIDYVTNNIAETMNELMKKLGELGRKTVKVVKKVPVYVDHAAQIIPDEVYEMLPDFLKKASLKGYFITLEVIVETNLSFDELMVVLERIEPDTFYTELSEDTIDKMVDIDPSTVNMIKDKMPTVQDLYDVASKINSPEMLNIAKMLGETKFVSPTCSEVVLTKKDCKKIAIINAMKMRNYNIIYVNDSLLGFEFNVENNAFGSFPHYIIVDINNDTYDIYSRTHKHFPVSILDLEAFNVAVDLMFAEYLKPPVKGELVTVHDFYNELCKMDSPEAHEFTKLMQECRSKQNNNKNERVNMCSSYRESDGKCNDTGKGCDGCASHYEIQNQKELLETGKGILSRMPGIGIIGISKGQPIYGCKHCNSGFEDDDFAFALETGICQYCHKSLCK